MTYRSPAQKLPKTAIYQYTDIDDSKIYMSKRNVYIIKKDNHFNYSKTYKIKEWESILNK